MTPEVIFSNYWYIHPTWLWLWPSTPKPNPPQDLWFTSTSMIGFQNCCYTFRAFYPDSQRLNYIMSPFNLLLIFSKKICILTLIPIHPSSFCLFFSGFVIGCFSKVLSPLKDLERCEGHKEQVNRPLVAMVWHGHECSRSLAWQHSQDSNKNHRLSYFIPFTCKRHGTQQRGY